MFRTRFNYFLLFLILGLGVLTMIIYVRRQKLLNLLLPEMTEITLVRGEIHNDTLFLNVNAIVLNKAPYDMRIDSIVCDLTLGGTNLVSTSQYVGINQKSGESDTVSFAVNVPISRTRREIRSLQGQDSTGVAIHATIVYSGLRIKLTKGKKIEVPVPPELRVIKTERTDLKLLKKDVKVDLFLEVINNGKNLSLDIEDLQYELTISNDLVTKGKYQKDVYIRPYSSLVLKFPLDFTMKHPAATIVKVWTDNDRVPFRLMLSGYLNVGKMKRVPVVLFASGKMEMVNEQRNRAQKKREKQARRSR